MWRTRPHTLNMHNTVMWGTVAFQHSDTQTQADWVCTFQGTLQIQNETINHCLIGFMTAAVPSQFLQIGSELISPTRVLLRIKEDVGGDQSYTGTNCDGWHVHFPHCIAFKIAQNNFNIAFLILFSKSTITLSLSFQLISTIFKSASSSLAHQGYLWAEDCWFWPHNACRLSSLVGFICLPVSTPLALTIGCLKQEVESMTQAEWPHHSLISNIPI